jgi:hypothetical protein
MEKLLLEPTTKTPEVKFDASIGLLELKGTSIPENSIQFYQPLDDWVAEYIKAPALMTTINIKLHYFNSSTSMWLVHLLMKFKDVYAKDKNITVNWHFEKGDEECVDAGRSFERSIHIPFNMIEYAE